jgi:hypothetical protein
MVWLLAALNLKQCAWQQWQHQQQQRGTFDVLNDMWRSRASQQR